MLESCIGDLGIPDIQRLEIGGPHEVLESFVGDARSIENQGSALADVFQVCQLFISNRLSREIDLPLDRLRANVFRALISGLRFILAGWWARISRCCEFLTSFLVLLCARFLVLLCAR